MTTLVPSETAASAQAPAPTFRQYIRYLFYKVRPSWRHELAAEDHAAMSAELAELLDSFADRLAVLRAFSTLGTRADADFALWMVSERLEDFQELNSAVLRTRMGAHFDTPQWMSAPAVFFTRTPVRNVPLARA